MSGNDGQSASARVPVSTFRVQLTKDYTFRHLISEIDYLHNLGITDIYAAPFLTARPGSRHGYDVVNHHAINPEIGSDDDLNALHDALSQRGMGLIADIVPNHMCVNTNDNAWWNDVLENGPSSPFAKYFDIEWRPPKTELKDKILLPILGDQYGKVLENAELQLRERDGALSVDYYDRHFPIGPRTYSLLLREVLPGLAARHDDESRITAELESIITAAERLPGRSETAPEKVRERQREKEILKSRLKSWLAEFPDARSSFDAALASMNGVKGEPRTFDALEELLAHQAYRLSFWRVAAEQINYRRFFDINDLAAIRIEEAEVLEAVHFKSFELLRRGVVTGLRVDHVDGLREPRQYLRNLSELAGGPYVVVEKILGGDERLPETWACAGTTGYEFLNQLNGIFVLRSGEKPLRAIYDELRSDSTRYDDMVFQSKRLILQASMSSELLVLARRLDRISEQHRWSRDFTIGTLAQVLTDTIASFPVYRTYVSASDSEVAPQDVKHVLAALARGKRRNPGVNPSAFDFLGDVLRMRDPEGITDEQRAERRDFVLRFQELTGPVMAKGVEDTTFYRYFPLLSLNEVGGGPQPFGTALEEFHRQMEERARTRPDALSATGTHDTKRAEDNRARINVLSEIPGEWAARVSEWRALARPLKPTVGDVPAPDDDDEYYIYQTLVGALPDRAELTEAFLPRVQTAVEKALRESKRHTTWINVDAPYEDAARTFLERLLDPKQPFLESFFAFAERIRIPAYWSSLSQLVVKSTAPGVPDFFQGSDLWDFSMVDPDNRRAVDFERRKRLLAELPGLGADRSTAVSELARTPGDGRIKLHLTRVLLSYRRSQSALVRKGRYLPLTASGPRSENVVAFARLHEGAFAVTLVGRYFAQLGAGAEPPPKDAWDDTTVRWPAELGGSSVVDAVTGASRRISGSDVRVSELFEAVPFCVIVRAP